MNDKPKGTTLPKQQLEIVKYEADVPYGQDGKTLDRLTAKNLSILQDDPLYGKPLRHTIFNGDLKSYLCKMETSARFLADVEERVRPDSQYGPDRTIVQVYDDKGQPVSTKKGGGGGQFRRSLEDDLALESVKRRSIEGQTSVAEFGQWIRNPEAKTYGLNQEQIDRIAAKYWKAVEKGLDNYLNEPAKIQTAKTKPVSEPRQMPQDTKIDFPNHEPDKKDAQPSADPIKHVGDLLTRASKLKPPVTREELVVGLSVNKPEEIKDLEAAWKTAQQISVGKAKIK